jgi:hypothetical protein
MYNPTRYSDADMEREQDGLASVDRWLAQHGIGKQRRVTSKMENIECGDIAARLSSAYLEVKTAPFDPVRYPRVFWEVGKVHDDPKTADGFARTAAALEMSVDELAGVWCTDIRGGDRTPYRLGHLSHMGVSLTSTASATWAICVNPEQHLYLYPCGQAIEDIKAELRAGGLLLGLGVPRATTYAVKTVMPPARWACRDGVWVWNGDGEEGPWLAALTSTMLPG